jgi:hypothetical protein
MLCSILTVYISKTLQIPHCFKNFYIQFSQCTKVIRVYDHFEGKLFICCIFITARFVANFKQPPRSNYSFVYVVSNLNILVLWPRSLKRSHVWPACQKVWGPLL